MNRRLEQLQALVLQHIGRYQGLAGILEEEQAALLSLDLDRIQQAAKAKETMVLKIKLLVPPLTQAIQDAALSLGQEPEPLPTLAELAKAAPEPYAKDLERAGLTLARLKRGITRHNDANHAYVREALDLVSGSISILTRAVHPAKGSYLPTGQRARPSGYGPTKLSREV
ncbi:MAG: flagellar export chaperone FlgN [Pseudomonadota bacterium]